MNFSWNHVAPFALLSIFVALGGCSSREALVVYSPHGADVLGDYEARFEAAHPDIDVQWLDLGSKQVLERIRAESARPVADVWWGAPASMFMQAADEGLLAEYEPTWSGAVGESQSDPDNFWYGTYASPLGIVYNTKGYDPSELPKTWDELLDPKWEGKITIRAPLESGTMRTFIGATMLREGGDEAGVAWLKKLHSSTEQYMPSPRQLFDHLKRNPERISVWLYPDIPLQRERNGFPLECIVPDETPVLVEAIAIVEGGPNPSAAQLFYEFVTTKEALIHQAEAYWKVPLRNDIKQNRLPEWVAIQSFEPQEIDWSVFAENEEHWAALWDDRVKRAQ